MRLFIYVNVILHICNIQFTKLIYICKVILHICNIQFTKFIILGLYAVIIRLIVMNLEETRDRFFFIRSSPLSFMFRKKPHPIKKFKYWKKNLWLVERNLCVFIKIKHKSSESLQKLRYIKYFCKLFISWMDKCFLSLVWFGLFYVRAL